MVPHCKNSRISWKHRGDAKVLDDPEKLPQAKHVKKLPAPKRGYVHTIDAGQLARGVQILAHGDKGKVRSSGWRC